MNYLNDIWKELLPMINWVIFAIVIGSGYFIRATPILKKISTTLKVFLFSLITTSAYTFYAEIEISIFISSYFISFGFHSAIIKFSRVKVNRLTC